MEHQINELVIEYDPEWKDIAISLSGGADSALLAYLLCKIITSHNANTIVHIITHTRSWKTKPWQRHHAINVFRYIQNTFDTIAFVRHENFIAPELEYENIGPNLFDEYGKQVSGDNIEQRAYAEFICHCYNIDAYYNAVTRNPRLAAFNGMTERDIEPTEDNQYLKAMKHMGRWAFHPFRFIEKNVIVNQYKEIGIMDLFDLTRSCEGVIEGINYETYQSGMDVPVCGECFWCKEREWAIEQNK